MSEKEPRAGDLLRAHLLGHEKSEQALLKLWAQDRLHHAWCISGPKGIGKATLAWQFAYFLLENTRPGGSGGASLFGQTPAGIPPDHITVDQDSELFRRLQAGSHGNLMVVERALDTKSGRQRSEIIVEDVRRLSDFFSKTAAEAGWRIAIIDSADELNRNASNALLKILEEPPERAILLLVAHSPGRLLATIRSRCQDLPLLPLSQPQTLEVLTKACPDMTGEEAKGLAILAEGAPGVAISLAREGGLDLYGRMVELLAALPSIPTSRLFAVVDDVARRNQPDRPLFFAGLLRSWLGRAIRAEAAGTELHEAVEGEGDAQARLLAAIPLDRWIEVWEKMGRLIRRTEALNLDRRQLVFSLFQTMEMALAR
jgi:DNA polymerase-3 subunit delta'